MAVFQRVRISNAPCIKSDPVFEMKDVQTVKIDNIVQWDGGGKNERYTAECKVHVYIYGAEGLLYVDRAFDTLCVMIDIEDAELFDLFTKTFGRDV